MYDLSADAPLGNTAVSAPAASDISPLLPPCGRASAFGVNYRHVATLLASGREEAACNALWNFTAFGGLLSVLGDPDAAACCPARSQDTLLPLAGALRYLTEAYPELIYRPLPAHIPASEKRIAVIGSGPAGLQGAWTLRQNGHDVTVFEAASMPGITLLQAPLQESGRTDAVRVPDSVAERTITMMRLSGIRFITSAPRGQTELQDMLKQYDLVFCACGKGAVLPADAHGQVGPKLFAAGTCVKNQKHLNAVQAMAFARKSARHADLLLRDGKGPLFSTPPEVQEKGRVEARTAHAGLRDEVARCLACACPES